MNEIEHCTLYRPLCIEKIYLKKKELRLLTSEDVTGNSFTNLVMCKVESKLILFFREYLYQLAVSSEEIPPYPFKR